MDFLKNPNFDFVRWRWHAIALSWAIVLAGVAVAVARGGVPLGIDFTGGTVVIVKFDQPVSEDVVRRALDPVTTDKVVQQYGDPALHELLIRMPLAAQQEGSGLDQNARATVEALTKANVGKFEVINKQLNPWWYPPASDWAKDSQPIPPGPGNPLGTRWMGLSAPGVGIHGTDDPASIGYSVSHGCIRMQIPDAERLFTMVSVGMGVYIHA